MNDVWRMANAITRSMPIARDQCHSKASAVPGRPCHRKVCFRLRRGVAWRGVAWHGVARHGAARRGAARHS
eukprot:9212522-Lingulodinium_polyedra.AAC.1